jgi:hypothetical protein
MVSQGTSVPFGPGSFVVRVQSKNIKLKRYRTIKLFVVVYQYATWFLTQREEHRLRVFDNVLLWKVFGPKKV